MSDQNGSWIPACGRTEVPFRTRDGRTLMYCWNPTTGEHAYLDWVPFRTRDGRTLMYCWNPTTGEHAYLDCESDMILSTEEAEMALGRLEKE